MGKNTRIEWADHSLNFWVGCNKISPGCDNCYAAAMMKRFGKDFSKITRTSPNTWRACKGWEPGFVFANSMSDFFHPAGDLIRPDAWDVIRENDQHIWIILTKRPEYIKNRLPADWGQGWPHVILGATIESQAQEWRFGTLFDIPAAFRIVSIEPMLSEINIKPYLETYNCPECGRGTIDASALSWAPDHDGHPTEEVLFCLKCGASNQYESPCKHCDNSGVCEKIEECAPLRPFHTMDEFEKTSSALNWVICGGESGPKARPLFAGWVRALRDACKETATPFTFKAWGEYVAESQAPEDAVLPSRSFAPVGWDARRKDCFVFKTGKRAAGRILDGKVHTGMTFEKAMARVKELRGR